MSRFFGTLILTLAYMEGVYHISCVGLRGMKMLFLVPVLFMAAGLEILLLSIGRRTVSRGMLWGIQAANYLVFASQMIYMRIFRQPLLTAAIINGGEDALKNYWQELLYAIGQNMVPLLFLAVPLPATAILIHRKQALLNLRKKRTVVRAHAISRIWGSLLMKQI